jgi:hypothetical protein
VRGGAAEGQWRGGGSCPLPSQYHTPLPSSDDTTADPAASNIADSAFAFAGAALAIGSYIASETLAIGSAFVGGASAIGPTIANCHSGDYQQAAIIMRVVAYTNAHYRGSAAECAPCHWTANTASLAGGICFLCGP